MKQNKIFKVGLTGGIGSGKSTISKILTNKGIKVIDCDKISRCVLEKYPDIIKGIEKKYGNKFIDENGKLKRREFGAFIFEGEERRRDYEALILPYVRKEVNNSIIELEEKGEGICVIDAPTLFEQSMDQVMDFNVVVWVDKETQFKRVKLRDELSDEEIINRINAQIPLDEKKKRADFVIDNTKSIEEAEEVVKVLIEVINDLRGVGKIIEKTN